MLPFDNLATNFLSDFLLKSEVIFITDNNELQRLLDLFEQAETKIKNFEFRHFRPHYLDVDTVFGDLGVNVSQS
jgi:hypothetical protein